MHRIMRYVGMNGDDDDLEDSTSMEEMILARFINNDH